MRIAFVTSEYVSEPYFAGGLANYLYQITNALKKFGHDPEIFVSSNKNETLVHNNVVIHRIKIDDQNWISQSKLLNNRLLEIHQQYPFDIVQHSSWMAVGLQRPFTIPSVVRLSSFNPLLNPHNNILENQLELHALKISNAVYSPSKFIATEVSKYLKSTIEVIETPYQSEVKKLNYSTYNKYLKNKKYLLFYGRITQNKGIDEISQIIFKLLNTNLDLYFVFIGDGTLNNIKKSAGIYSDRVIHLHPLRHQYLYPIINRAQTIILPSRVENLSNACIESMAHGKIVVGTNGTSFEQLIVNGKNGFLVNVADSDDLLSKINIVLRLSKNKKNEIEREAKKTINRLSFQEILNQLIPYYQQVINSTKVSFLSHCYFKLKNVILNYV